MLFDGLPREVAEERLLACCASRRWAAAVLAGRPYGSAEALLGAADHEIRALEWPDVAEALDAHPRIGDRAAGADRASSWSQGEQAGVEDADRRALAEGNAAYERRFGYVFLICASGRDSGEMLGELRCRLGNDDVTERGVVHAELAAITHLRLRKLLA